MRLLLPQDDLALATVLKSPLFGFDDDDLFKIASGRGQVSLRASLLGKAADDARFAEAAMEIERLTDTARKESPFTFYARLLGAHGGRRKFLARLGLEANDALDEFLNLALVYESRETPSLQGFIAWLRAAQAEVKRDMEMARDEVRVMTVHGAKGLEAHTVILADTTTPPAGYYPPRLIELPVGQAGGMIWVTARDNDSPAMSAARQQTIGAIQDEYRRLLYVAMTRAKARLIVCGTAVGNRKDGKPEGCWYSLIETALLPRSKEADAADGEKILQYEGSVPTAPPADDMTKRPMPASPAWLTQAAAPEPIGAKLITPSDTPDEEWIAASGAPGLDRETALARGRLTHRLMQSLPDIAPDRRADIARDYLSRAGAGLDETERDEIAQRRARRSCRSALRAAFRARQPRGSSDRRASCAQRARAPCDLRTGGPAGGDAGFGADRRLQDQPGRAAPARRGHRELSGLCPPVGALSSPTHPHLSRPGRARGIGVDGNPPSDGVSGRCAGYSAGSAHLAVSAVLTPIGGIHRFPVRIRIFRDSKGDPMAVGKVSDATFEGEVLKASGPVVVDFWAEWCGPCRMIAPALEELAGSLGDKVKIVKLNVDENQATAVKYNIMSIPTLLLFKDGKIASQHQGAAPKQKLEQWITSAA